MTTFFAFIFFIALVVTIVTFIAYIVTVIRNKRSKFGLISGVSFIVCAVAITLSIRGIEKEIENYMIPENKQAVISYSDYSMAKIPHVLAALGEPDTKSESIFDEHDEFSPLASTWTYYDKRLEFYFIDEKLVQFTYYGNDQPYNDINEVFALFGIRADSELNLVSDSGKILRFKDLDSYGIIDEFSLTQGSTEKTIGIVKVTYDSKYF